jgi:hypothetical protein
VPPLPFLFLSEKPLAFFFGSNSGSPSFFLTKSRQAVDRRPQSCASRNRPVQRRRA